MASPTLIDRAAAWLRANAKAFATLTKIPYVPNKQEYQADGARWGASYASLDTIRRAQEFALAINALARGASAATPSLVRVDARGGEVKVTDKGLPVVQLLRQPNPLHSWRTWIETLIWQLIPEGNAYILKDPISLAGTPMSLWLLRPDRTRPIRQDDPRNPVQAYEHYAEDGTRYVFPPEQVIHIKNANPFTDYQGLGYTQLLSTVLEMDVRSAESNVNLFRMGGRLSTVIEMPEGFTDPDKAREMQRKIREAHSGSENAHRALVLTDGAKMNAQASNAGPKEADYSNTRLDLSRTIGGMLGVPPMKMGYIENANRASSTIQRQQFLEDGLWPVLRAVQETMTRIVELFDPSLEFKYDYTAAMDAETMTAMLTAGANAGALSPNDVREKFLQMPREESNPAMEKHWVSAMSMAIEDGPAPAFGSPTGPAAKPAGGLADAVPELGAGDGKDKPATGLQPPPLKPGDKAEGDPAAGPKGSLEAPPSLKALPKQVDAEGREIPRGTAEQRRYLRQLRDARPRIEKAIAVPYKAWLLAFGKQAADAMQARHSGKAIKRDSAPALAGAVRKAAEDATEDALKNSVSSVYETQLVTAAKDTVEIFGVALEGFEPGGAAFTQAKVRLAQQVKYVTQSTKDELSRIINEGAAQGLNPWQIANGTADGSFLGIRGTFEQIAQERAMLIARTETAHLQDEANAVAYKEMGVDTCDVIGCEDFKIMPGETYGCNSQGVPVAALPIRFHPNHNGAVVPARKAAP